MSHSNDHITISKAVWQGGIQGGGGWRAAAPQKTKFKKTDFVDIVIPKVLHDLPSSQKQPQKLAVISPLEFWKIN
jgi:hypothetical protein